MTVTKEKIRDYILSSLDPQLKQLGLKEEEITDELLLIGSGVIDSLGFLNLVAKIENKFNVEFNFEQIDPKVFTTLGGFVSCAETVNKNDRE